MMRNSMQQVTTVHIHNICQSTCSALETGVFLFLDQELLLLIDKENIRYRLDTELGIPAVKGTSKFRENAASDPHNPTHN